MKIAEKISQKCKDYKSLKPLTIAFLGDSVTHGCFELNPAPNDGYYCVYDNDAVYHTRFKKKFNIVDED